MINKDETKVMLQNLKLHGMATMYESVMNFPSHKQPTTHELIAQMAHAEQEYRTQKRMQMYLRLSKLRYDSVLEHVKCSPERNFDKDQLTALADCGFIRRAENILISGATGSGKSYLACALGRQACMMGYKTIYFGMIRFIERIVQTKLDGTFIKFLDQINKNQLLIIDDFGIAPVDNQVKVAILQILEDRYDKKSTIIASQLPVEKWYDYLNDVTLADAIIDRLSASANIINFTGSSLRGEKLKKNY